MKIISFWGSTHFSLEILKALYSKHKEGKVNLKYVVSQPAKPVGRKQVITHNPVGQFCIDNEITLYTPTKLIDLYNEKSVELTTDISFVAAYGKIISEKILATAKEGFVNFHGSILPKYRGAIPVQMTVMNQDEEGGITLIKMDKGMDTGEIIKKSKAKSQKDMTSGELMARLAELSAEIVQNDFDLLINSNQWQLEPQNDSEATTCFVHEMDKKNFEINYMDGIKLAHGKIMAASPEPRAWVDREGMNLHLPFAKINFLRSKYNPEYFLPENYDEYDPIPIADLHIKPKNRLAFHIDSATKRFFLELHDGFLEIIEIQPEGKNTMDAKSFINGYSREIKK